MRRRRWVPIRVHFEVRRGGFRPRFLVRPGRVEGGSNRSPTAIGSRRSATASRSVSASLAIPRAARVSGGFSAGFRGRISWSMPRIQLPPGIHVMPVRPGLPRPGRLIPRPQPVPAPGRGGASGGVPGASFQAPVGVVSKLTGVPAPMLALSRVTAFKGVKGLPRGSFTVTVSPEQLERMEEAVRRFYQRLEEKLKELEEAGLQLPEEAKGALARIEEYLKEHGVTPENLEEKLKELLEQAEQFLSQLEEAVKAGATRWSNCAQGEGCIAKSNEVTLNGKCYIYEIKIENGEPVLEKLPCKS